jgi:1,4-dihydroxy-2-naphthoyl-CoA hydrolase
MLFTTKNKVRMHDTDMAGILYFPRIFRYVHDALEDLMESEGFSFDKVFHEKNFVFVIVHCEADYHASVKVGDNLEIHVGVERIGNSSFTMIYQIYKSDQTHIGSAKTVHVTLERMSRQKVPIPPVLHQVLTHYLVKEVTSH